MNRSRGFLVAGTIFGIWVLGMLGMSPLQSERPPQPFFQDFFSGSVLLQGKPPPEGTSLVACIDECKTGFESTPYMLSAGGTFDQLEVNPPNENLVGHIITFYLVNEYGRIRAEETRAYVGVFDFYVQNLTFVEPLPSPKAPRPPNTPAPTVRPTPTASLPVAGDPAVRYIPKVALFGGLVAVIVGGALIGLSRRRDVV